MTPSGSVHRRIHDAALRLFAERGIPAVSISELAEAAGVARGTIYNNVEQPDALFESVAVALAADMDQRIQQLFTALATVGDPAVRLAIGIRLWIRRAHAEPHWGRFQARFALSNASLQALWSGPPVADLRRGIDQGRYRCRLEQLPSMAALVAGTVLGAILLVLEGRRTWRDAGSDAVEFVLTALGLSRDEASVIAMAELPALPEAP